MRVFHVFCTVLVSLFVLIAIITVQPAQATVYYEYLCGNDTYLVSCTNAGFYRCKNGSLAATPDLCATKGGILKQVKPAVCGDGFVDTGEVCDNGALNSDGEPNKCRTDCRAYYCGDGVRDIGEECDNQNGNGPAPNNCRDNCTLPVCGDGIHDDSSYASTVFNEECDDGNNNDLDGCRSDCTICLQLSSNINVTADTTLCRQVFNVDDYGPEGVIIIQHPGVTLDCDGATLQGAGGNAGIYVMQASNVTVKNCTVTGYDVGIKVVDSQNVKFGGLGNNMSGNTKPVELENSQLALPQAQSSTAVGDMSVQAPIKIDAQPGQTGEKFKAGVKTPGLVKPGVKKPEITKQGVKTPGLVKPGVSGRSILPGRQPAPGQPGKKTTDGLAPTKKIQKTKSNGEEPEQAQPGPNKMPIDPFGKKSMPIDPLGKNILPVIQPVQK